MSFISTSRFTRRLSRKLQRAGVKQWVGRAAGRYIRLQVGGDCIGSCGYTEEEAEEIVRRLIRFSVWETVVSVPLSYPMNGGTK